jgi:protein-L-isoaspartate O-methyltransferase
MMTEKELIEEIKAKQDILKRIQSKAIIKKAREEFVKEQFKSYVGRDMTQEEYDKYSKEFEEVDGIEYKKKNEKCFNLYDWIKENIKNG